MTLRRRTDGRAQVTSRGAQPWDVALPAAVDAAIRNVAAFGDTDLFPGPVESQWIAQAPEKARDAVLALHARLQRGGAGPLGRPEALRALFPVGHSGYRLGTQIDPVWNLYLLALVILAGPAMEAARPPRAREAVYSFRFTAPDVRGRLFDPECGWRAFTQRALVLARTNAQAVVCDIADFYHRISPSMAQAALRRAGVEPELARAIARVLRTLGGERLGLPIGGPASRLIAEAVLASVDDMLHAAGVTYCRFVDDIRLFAPTREAALGYLALLSHDLLLRGFSLQKSKTRLLPGRELAEELAIGQGLQLEPSKGGAASVGGAAASAADLRSLLLAPAQFDPYSGLRAQRDVRLEAFAQDPGALPLLRREFTKSRVNPAVARNMLSALAFMPGSEAEQALHFLLDARRQTAVLPVVGKLLTVALEQAHRLDEGAQQRLRDALLSLLGRGGALLHLPSSRSLALRVLQELPPAHNPATQALLQRLFADPAEPLVRREVLALWGAWRLAEPLLAAASGPRLRSAWERRALAWALVRLGHKPMPARARSVPRSPSNECDAAWWAWLSSRGESPGRLDGCTGLRRAV